MAEGLAPQKSARFRFLFGASRGFGRAFRHQCRARIEVPMLRRLSFRYLGEGNPGSGPKREHPLALVRSCAVFPRRKVCATRPVSPCSQLNASRLVAALAHRRERQAFVPFVKLAIPHVWRIRPVRGKGGRLTPNILDVDAQFRRSCNSDDALAWQHHRNGDIYGSPALRQHFGPSPRYSDS